MPHSKENIPRRTGGGNEIAFRSLEKIRFGPAGWSYPDWKGFVYPRKKPKGFHELTYLTEFFDTVEINTSFYQPLKPESCREWLRLVAGNPRFVFTGKLWQQFTHIAGATAKDEALVRAGYDVLHGAGKLGALLIQFPFSFHRNPENTAHLKTLLQKFREYPLVVEVRHATWNTPEFFELLREHKAGFCNVDQPVIGRSLEPSAEATSPVGYVRFHGRRYDTWFNDDPKIPSYERYNHYYTQEELKPWAERIETLAENKETEALFVVTNNHYAGKSVATAMFLLHLLYKKKVKVPEPLREQYPEVEEIAEGMREAPRMF